MDSASRRTDEETQKRNEAKEMEEDLARIKKAEETYRNAWRKWLGSVRKYRLEKQNKKANKDGARKKKKTQAEKVEAQCLELYEKYRAQEALGELYEEVYGGKNAAGEKIPMIPTWRTIDRCLGVTKMVEDTEREVPLEEYPEPEYSTSEEELTELEYISTENELGEVSEEEKKAGEEGNSERKEANEEHDRHCPGQKRKRDELG